MYIIMCLGWLLFGYLCLIIEPQMPPCLRILLRMLRGNVSCWGYKIYPRDLCQLDWNIPESLRGFKYMRQIYMQSFGLSPLPVTVANEGLGWDPRA